MSDSSFTIQVPGKLMIAGEFAVLEPHHQLVVMAVDRFVYASVKQSSKKALSLLDFGINDLDWEFKHGKMVISTNDKRIRFVEDAMYIAFRYLQEQQIEPHQFKLTIKSELDDESGIKYGLGSSAAVVTSVIAAILHEHLASVPAADLVFRLAAIAHVKTQGSGSGADVAASSFGGFLQYTSFQADWLQQAFQKAASISGLVNMDWPYYTVRPMCLPASVYMCVGWTGSPASTAKLIDKIKGLDQQNAQLYTKFLQDSEQAVQTFITGFNRNHLDSLFSGVKQNRQALRTVGENAGVAIETPLLTTLCDLAEEYGGAGKPSGAGGGDCGIAFLPSKQQAEQLTLAWEQAGIKPLTISPCLNGAIRIKEES